jgi:hypothetical protein
MYKITLLAIIAFVVIVSFNSSADAQDEVIKWNEAALETLKTAATDPVNVSRDLAIVHIAVFDSLNSIDRLYTPIHIPWQPLAGPTNRVVTVAAAAHRVLTTFYPSQETELDAILADTLSSVAAGEAVDNAIALGTSVADDIMLWRSTDGWDATSSYVPDPNTPGKWRPTPPAYAPPLAPHWGDVLPFAMPDPNDFMPPAPPALDSQEYADAVNEVMQIGEKDSAYRTADQDEIAEFWNDFPGLTAAPAGKWNIISQVVAEQMNTNMLQNARIFAMLNIAAADAGIESWRAKYEYDLWRPITAIREADTDGNPSTTAAPSWEPQWPTPNFPECTSGHSTFSGASANVLTLIYDANDISFSTHAGFDVLPGVLRSYNSLWEAAEEAGMSRLYGGIHFMFGNLYGLDCGAEIGVEVYENFCLASTANFAGGDGSVSDPYQITDLSGLQAINNDLTANYILMNDIDLDGIVFTDAVVAPLPNTPAVSGSWANPFSGTFDGNGKVISNLAIQKTNTDVVSMFGDVAAGALVKNLGLENVDIAVDNGSFIAAIASGCGGTVENCYATGSISGYRKVGGIVAEIYGDGLVKNCYVDMQLTATNEIVGGIAADTLDNAVIENCYASVTLTGTISGAVAGRADGNAQAIESFYNSDLAASTALGEGKTTSQLQNPQTFINADWNFVSDWKQINGQYPVLMWEYVVITADINSDGIVNILDFTILASQWLVNDQNQVADINNDETVDHDDLMIMAEQWLVSNY